jgi:predicted nucleic-acid-binding Zn-ribbon protein
MIGWKCPKCGSTFMDIQAVSWIHMIQTMDRTDGIDENEWSTTSEKDIDWNHDSPASCNQCGYEEKLSCFEWESGPPGTITVTAEKIVI